MRVVLESEAKVNTEVIPELLDTRRSIKGGSSDFGSLESYNVKVPQSVADVGQPSF